MNPKLKAKLLLGTFLVSGLFSQMSNISITRAAKGKHKTKSSSSQKKTADPKTEGEPHESKPKESEKFEGKSESAPEGSKSEEDSSTGNPPPTKKTHRDEEALDELEQLFIKILHRDHIAPEEMAIVDKAIEAGIHKDVIHENNRTALHIAVISNNKDMVKKLVTDGKMNVNKHAGGSLVSETPVTLAIHNQRDEILNILMAHGGNLADAFYQIVHNEQTVTPAWANIVSNFIKIPENQRPCPHDISNDTIVYGAIFSGNIDLLQQMIENGYDINKADSHGNTPLHIAARSGNLDVVEFVWRVCDKTATRKTNRDGQMPLHVAVSYKHPRGGDWATMNAAWEWYLNTYNYNPEVVKFLFRMDPLVVILPDNNGLTPLDIALKPMLHCYIKPLTPKNAIDLRILPFINVCKESKRSALQSFLTITDAQNRTILHKAVLENNPRATEAILQQSNFTYMLKTYDNDGNTPQYIAKEKGYGDIVELLHNFS